LINGAFENLPESAGKAIVPTRIGERVYRSLIKERSA
jgi:hypothetical protein